MRLWRQRKVEFGLSIAAFLGVVLLGVLPGLVIYRFDGPLFFANAKTFRDEVKRLAKADPPPAWIVIAAEPSPTWTLPPPMC